MKAQRHREAKRLLPITIDKRLPFISPVSRDCIGKRNPPHDETYVISENLFSNTYLNIA